MYKLRVRINGSELKDKLMFPERCTYLDKNDGSVNWTCQFLPKSQIHKKLGCRHYSEIRKRLEENLPSNEFEIFNILQGQMKILDTNFKDKEGQPSGTFSSDSGEVFTNIEEDAEGIKLPNGGKRRPKYQVTIHELWHNIDFIAGKRFITDERIKDVLLRTDTYRTYVRLKNEMKNSEGIDIGINSSYLFKNNLIGNIFEEGTNNYSLIDAVEEDIDNLVEEFNSHSTLASYFDENRKYDGILIYRDYNRLAHYFNKECMTLQEINDISIENDRFAFHYLSDILSGDYYAHKREFNFSKYWLTRTPMCWNARNQKLLFATECFADIGCTKGANPSGMNLIKRYLPKTCQVYDKIMVFIKESLM